MNQRRFHFFKFIFILLSINLFAIDVYGQTDPEIEQTDSTNNGMSEEGGKNYAPAYSYYIQSLFPTTIEQTLIDTSVYKPYNEDISLFSHNLYANLGIFGQAHYSMNFSFYRKHGFSYKTLPYSSYLRTIENWKFFLPEGVYTNLQYNFSNVKENHFSVSHAQKIYDNLYLDMGLESIIAEGRYLSQKIRTVNFGTSLRYNLPSNRYGLAAYYYLNLIKNQENGGIAADSLFESGTRNASSIEVNFSRNNANTHIFQNTFFLRQYLSLSGKEKQKKRQPSEQIKQTELSELSEEETEEQFEENSTTENTDKEMITIKNKLGYIVHDFEFGSSKNFFSATNLNANQFSTFNFSNDATKDSAKFYQVRNTIIWSSFKPEDTMPDRKHFIRFSAGVMYTYNNLKDMYIKTENTITRLTDTIIFVDSITSLEDTIFHTRDTTIKIRDTLSAYNDHQFTVLGMVHLKLFNRLQIKAHALVTLNGYNAGDVTIDGKMYLGVSHRRKANHEVLIKMALYNYSPDYFFTRLMINNYQWIKKWEKQQTIVIGISWEYKNYSVGLNYYTLNNYMLLNEDCQPEQVANLANVYQFAAYIPFHFKGFGLNSNIYAQYTDNKRIKIPVFATRQTVYYGFSVFKKALYLQVGIDFLYNTAYYANAYNPVLQQFYLQNEKQVGNYPYLDVFLRAKLNRFQFQVKGTHLYAGLLGYNYYHIPHYPAKDMGFALGIFWNFYD